MYNSGVATLLFSEIAGVWQTTNTNPVSGIDNTESTGQIVACTSDGGCSTIGHFSDGTTSRAYATSEKLISAEPPTVPRYPSVAVKGGEITVRWNTPKSPGTSPITHYTVSFSPGGRSFTVKGRTWINRVRGFSPTKHYVVAIVASNAVGNSPVALLQHVMG